MITQNRPYRRGFTLVEALTVLGIIVLLAGILLVALRGARKTGDETAERSMVVAINQSVQYFKEQFGFLPPLVVVSRNPDNVTIITSGSTKSAQVWTALELDGTNAAPNNDGVRGSEQSLAYFLCGSLDSDFDGADGYGFTAPSKSQDGTFSHRGKRYEPMIDPLKFKTKRGAPRLYRESVGVTSPTAAQQANCGILSHWTNPPGAGPLTFIRYYRWLPAYQTTGSNKGQIKSWNIPVAIRAYYKEGLNDPFDNTQAPKELGLRDAEYAIISPGPDGLFGDEKLADLRLALHFDVATPEQQVREKAAADNIIEVGR